MSLCRYAFTFLFASSLLASSNAQFHVDPATIFESVQTLGGTQTTSSAGVLTSQYLAFNPMVNANAQSLLTLNGVPFVSTHTALTGASLSRAVSEIRYDVQVIGPANVFVPIIVHVGLLSASVTRSGGSASAYSIASAEATLGITNENGLGVGPAGFSAMYRDHILDQFGSPLDSGNNFQTDTSLVTRANTDIVSIDMGTFAEVTSAGDASDGIANSYLDPYISIDPSFADASLYSLVLSPGVPNTQPVPEPASFAAFGLGAVIFMRRSREQRPVVR